MTQPSPLAPEVRRTLSEAAATLLSNTTKSAPQWSAITPRWLANLLPWQPVEAGAYRVNRVADGPEVIADGVECSPTDDSPALPESFVDYAPDPREYVLNAVTAVLEVQTRVTDIHNFPHDQVREQLRLTIEKVKESQDDQLINNTDYGLLNQVSPNFRVATRAGAPTPDDLDELLALVWKQPSFFLAHPRALAAFGRECTRRGVPPVVTGLFGAQFITWRGVPIIPIGQAQGDRRQERHHEHPARAHRPRKARCRGPLSTRRARGGAAEPVGAVHGHRPERRRLLPRDALLLGGCPLRGRGRCSR